MRYTASSGMRGLHVQAVIVTILASSNAAAQLTDRCDEGRVLLLARKYAEAQGELWNCVQSGPVSRESAYLLAQTFRELKNYQAGLKEIDRIQGPDPSVDLLYLKGFLLFRTAKHRESIDVLGQAFRLDPRDWRVHQVFALNYVVMEINDGALHELQVALELNPANAELHYQLARFYYSQNRVAESVAASGKALAFQPGYADVHGNLGLCYEALGDDSKAKEHFEMAIELNRRIGHTDEWPHLNYASLLIKREEADRSLSILAEALKQNPASGRAYYLRGKAYRKLDRLDDAKRDLERSVELDPADPGPFYELGALLRRMGDAAGSKRMFDRFQTLSARQPKL